MAKRDRAAELMAALGAARAAGASAATPVVIKALADAAAPVVEKAARVAIDLNLDRAGTALADALRRLLDGDHRNASAVVALIQAMRRLRADDRELYRRALRCRWTEPVYGGSADVGASVRAEACRAIVESGDANAALLLAGVLFERHPSPPVEDHPAARVAAAQGLGVAGDIDAAEVLYVKLTRSPPDGPEVLGECCGSYARLNPAGSEAELARWMATQSAEVLEACAIPLGEVRTVAAWRLLEELHRRLLADGREASAFTGLALVRQPAATDLLLRRLADAPREVAMAAAEALSLLRHDADVHKRVDLILCSRPDGRDLARAFAATSL